MSMRGSPGELGEATESPSHIPPPIRRGSGVVIETPLLNPLLLSKQLREQMDAHIQRKRLQLLWGLPHLIQSSLERSVPYLLGFLVCTALKDNMGHQRPLFKIERRMCLEHHLREKAIHSKWGLPRRIIKSLQVPLPRGSAGQKSNCSPDAPVAPTAQHKVQPPNTGPSNTDTKLDGSENSHNKSLHMKLIEETLHQNPSHLFILGKQEDLPLVSNKGRLDGYCSTHSLAPSQVPWVGSPTFFNEIQDTIGAARYRLDLQGSEREQPDQCAVCMNQELFSVDRCSSRQAIHWIGKPDKVSRNPLQVPGLSLQGVPKPANGQELQLQTSQDNISRLALVSEENRRTGIRSFPKTKPLEGSPLPKLRPEKVVLEQDQSLALQRVKWMEVEQKDFSLTRFQEKRPPTYQVRWWNLSPTTTRPVTSPNPESLKSQTHSCQADAMSVGHLEGNPESQGAKAFLEGDQKRYLEFHLHEKLAASEVGNTSYGATFCGKG